jgi:hypothetical protein
MNNQEKTLIFTKPATLNPIGRTTKGNDNKSHIKVREKSPNGEGTACGGDSKMGAR